MPLFDFLISKKPLREQRERAIDFAEERYDPAQFSPQVNLFREQAIEGISEGREDIARQRTVESLFRPTDFSIYGGQQQRAIAGQQARTRQQQQGLAEFESRLTEADIQAQQQGRQGFAQARTQQLQTAAQRDAAIEEARMQYEAELDKRRQQIGSTIGKVAGIAAAAIPGVGPLAAGAIGVGAGGLLGGGGGAVQGGASGLTTGLQFQEQQQQQTPQQPQTPVVEAQRPSDQAIRDPLTQEELTLGETQQQRTVGNIFDEQITSEQARNVSNLVQPLQETDVTPSQPTPQTTMTVPSREMLLGNVGDSGEAFIQQPQLDGVQQEIELLEQKSGDLTFEEFQRLEDLKGQLNVQAQRNVMGRIRQEAEQSRPSISEIGNRFSNLFGNVQSNLQTLGEFLVPTQEQRYQQYINQ